MKFNLSTDLKGIAGVLGAIVAYVIAYAPVAQQMLPNQTAKDVLGTVLAVASGIALILSDTGVKVPKVTPVVTPPTPPTPTP